MLCGRISGSPVPFPSGYKLKQGELCRLSPSSGGTTRDLQIPEGVIPLTLSIEGKHKLNNQHSDTQTTSIIFRDNLGKVLFNAYMTMRKDLVLEGNPATAIDIASVYGFDYETMKGITTITEEFKTDPARSIGCEFGTVRVTQWLEK